MATRVETDITVKRFGFVSDGVGKRFVFPRAENHDVTGSAGSITYGAKDLVLDGLEGRIDTLRWTADAATIGGAWLRDAAGHVDMAVEKLAMPDGLRLVRAAHGVEIVAPSVILSEMKLTLKGPFSRSSEAQARTPEPRPPAPPSRELRQEKLRFLDSLQGRIATTVNVALDLPVIGTRRLDQELNVAIAEGSLDYRALEDNLDWLEGAFLDIKHDGNRLKLVWKVPIFGSTHELIGWRLDRDAQTLASFGRVPVRSFADSQLPPSKPKKPDDKQTLQSLSLDAIDIALSLLAPRSLEVGGGVIMFGGEDQPGMVDLRVKGAINSRGPGTVTGAVGSVDTTLKDVQMGAAKLTADRLHFDEVDTLEVTFEGFSPVEVNLTVHRVTATGLSLQIGR
ncbi:MAG TPA: hypothetical protein VFP84_18300 [Kofleriaceae bacterium]|nr:hypothetical protein [Kofleriaceae bacterium]